MFAFSSFPHPLQRVSFDFSSCSLCARSFGREIVDWTERLLSRRSPIPCSWCVSISRLVSSRLDARLLTGRNVCFLVVPPSLAEREFRFLVLFRLDSRLLTGRNICVLVVPPSLAAGEFRFLVLSRLDSRLLTGRNICFLVVPPSPAASEFRFFILFVVCTFVWMRDC